MDNRAKQGSGKNKDRIERDCIILYDDASLGSRILKTIVFVSTSGPQKKYTLRRTSNGGYIMN